MIYECGSGHLSTDPGTCHVAGCYKRLREREAPSPKAAPRLLADELSTLNVSAYVDMARAHLAKEVPANGC